MLREEAKVSLARPVDVEVLRSEDVERKAALVVSSHLLERQVKLAMVHTHLGHRTIDTEAILRVHHRVQSIDD